MIYKTQTEQHFIKDILFPKCNKRISGHLQKLRLPEGTTKYDFDKDSVLSRFDHQLISSGINTSSYNLSPDFSWSSSDISQIKNYYHQLDKIYCSFSFLFTSFNF